jgi:hypothetical protein
MSGKHESAEANFSSEGEVFPGSGDVEIERAPYPDQLPPMPTPGGDPDNPGDNPDVGEPGPLPDVIADGDSPSDP